MSPDNDTFLIRRYCPLCKGGKDGKTALEFPCKAAPGLRCCPCCGFIFSAKVPNFENPALYEESFAEGNVNPTFQKGPDGKYRIRNAAKLKRLIENLEPYRKTGRLLDVGCSAAFFLSLAKDRGWQPTGVEISKWASEFSRRELGVDVFHGMLEDAAYPNGTFDVVFSSHVIEHIGDSVTLVNEMRRILRPGGALVSIIPSQFASPNWKLRSRFRGDAPPKHVSFFNRRNFELMLVRSGFKPLSTKYNVELMRLYEMFLTERQLADRWNARMASVQSSEQHSAKAFDSGSLKISNLKAAVNLIGNCFGFGDEIVSIAINPES